MDVIDLDYLHRADPNVPIEESVGALPDLVREGKVRHIRSPEAAALRCGGPELEARSREQSAAFSPRLQ